MNHKFKQKIFRYFVVMIFYAAIFFYYSPVKAVQNDRSDSALSAFAADLAFIASAPRVPQSSHHKKVMHLCFQRLKALGYDTELSHYGTGTNVIGTLAGRLKPEKIINISAHYDTIKQCNGADDNGSGIAGILAIAKNLAGNSYAKTIQIACWDEEERGLLGSKNFSDQSKLLGTEIEMAFVFEMIGFSSNQANSQSIPAGFDKIFPQAVHQIRQNQSRGDFVLLVHDNLSLFKAFDVSRYAEEQGLKYIQLHVPSNLKFAHYVQDLRRSDHTSFWKNQFPAMMITDTANFRNSAYHCQEKNDLVEQLDLEFSLKIINTFSELIKNYLNL